MVIVLDENGGEEAMALFCFAFYEQFMELLYLTICDD